MAADLEKAVSFARLYQGSDGTTTIKQAQRLYDRMVKACQKVADARGFTLESVMDQVGAEAKRRGAVIPQVGKDV